MKFTPKTEEQLKAENQQPVFPKGRYAFETIKATEKVSKKGAPMIEIVNKVFAPDGQAILVMDFLSEAFMSHKLRHYACGTGLADQYDSGEINESLCVGRAGYLFLDIAPEKHDVKDGQPVVYPARNKVSDYDATAITKDSDVPF